MFERFVCVFTGEFMLTKFRWSNGSSAITFRSVWTSVVIYLFFLGFTDWLDPSRRWAFDRLRFQDQLRNNLPYLGAIFAGVYAALYSRFSSQWEYLANVYNQIKAVECEQAESLKAQKPLSEWKAGFIEDAVSLHLASKEFICTYYPRLERYGTSLEGT